MAANRFPVLRGPDAQQSRVQDNVQNLLGPVAKALQNTPIMGGAHAAWVTPALLNGFVAAPGALGPAYQVDAYGRTNFRGRAACAAGAGALTVVFVIPIDARPGGTHLFPVAGVAAIQNVIVEANGNVSILNAVAAAGQISFEFSYQVGG